METYECLKLDNQLCFPLYACAKEIVRRYRKPLDKLNLTYTQYLVMMVLWENGETTEGELGRRIRLDSGTLAPLLKRLEKQGYIKRRRPENNERRLFIELTDEGEALKEKAVRVPAQIAACIDLPVDEMMQMKILLEKALIKMEENK